MQQKRRVVRSVTLAAILVLVSFFFIKMRSFADDSRPTDSQNLGRGIYRNGTSPGTEIRTHLQTDITAPARNFPCANCHGLEGEGGKEGGFNVPPLRWEILTTARASGTSSRARLPYAENSVRRAISSGLNPAGLPLSPAMPRYQMDDGQMNDLVAYLKILGIEADADPGLNSTTIRVGTILPITGPQAVIGTNVQAVLQAYFDKVNSAGGIYGRKFELIVSDSRGQAQTSITALHELADRKNVFALIANYVPNSAVLDDELAALNIPLVSPISFGPQANIVDHYRFDILPSFADQARCLVTYVESQLPTKTTRRYAVVHSRGSIDLGATAGFSHQIQAIGVPKPAEFQYETGKFSFNEAEEFLKKNRPDFVFFFGNNNELKAIIKSSIANNLSIRFLTTTAMSADFPLSASEDEADVVWLAHPLTMSKEISASLRELERDFKVRITNPAFGIAAYTAADVFTEAVKRSGRRLSRARLINGLESFREFKTKFMQPITFGTNIRNAAGGCIVVKVDPKTQQYAPLSDWIAVESEP